MSRILLVEDDVWLGELYRDTLEQHGFSVSLVSSAAAAFGVLDKEGIDLIILDMILAQHNGIEFLHEIASYTDINTLPVIILSSVYRHDAGMSEARWRHYGVVEYLYKPQVKPYHLAAVVEKQLAREAA